MWDDDRDRKTMRNQMIVFIVFTVLLALWFQFFLPTPRPGAKKPEQTLPMETGKPSQGETSQKPTVLESPALPEGKWAALPPVPENADPATDEIVIGNKDLELVFTRIGGRLKRAVVKLHQHRDDEQQLVPPAPDTPDTEAVYPFGLRFSDKELGDRLDRCRFDVEEHTPTSVTFALTVGNVAAIRKTFTLGEASYTLRARVDYGNLGTAEEQLGLDDTPAYTFAWAPNVASGDTQQILRQYFAWRQGGLFQSLQTAKLGSKKHGVMGSQVVRDPEWVAVKSTYFIVAMKPAFDASKAEVEGNENRFEVGLAVPSARLAPDETLTNEFQIYLGPTQVDCLAAAWGTLPTALRFFQSDTWAWMDWFAKLLLRTLNLFYAVLPNYGVAIILLTILVRAVMIPLTLKSMRSMKKMQLLQPEMEAIRQQYKDQPQEQQKKIMELYRERGVNPFGGCFPMLLQMPVFIALYRVYACAIELRGAPFMLWIEDLSQPDRLLRIPGLAGLPFVGTLEYLNVLPILMGLSMVLSQKVTPTSGPAQNPQQKMMMTFMPIFFSFICYNMASGLNLYILTSTILGVVQQKFVRPGDMADKPKKAPHKPQHFYHAAQAKQRELKKEMRKRKHQARLGAHAVKDKRRKHSN